MTIEELKAFLRCAELGSLSAAARAERMPKSSLSRLLRALEAGLAVRLLERSARGVVLTEEGRALLPHARQVLDDLDLAAAAARTFAHGPTGLVRLSAPYSFGLRFIAPLLPEFLAQHPGVNIQLELTSRNVDLIAEGFDLAVRIGAVPPALVGRKLLDNPLLLAASPGYLAARGRPETPEALARHDLLLIGAGRSVGALKLARDAAEQVVAIAPRLLSNDPSVIVCAAEAGVGIGQVPRILVEAALADGRLLPVLPGWRMAEVAISLILPSGRALVPRVRVLADFLTARLRATGQGAGC
jgi:DNA-binding transcriptional LysR family regulator